MKVTLEQILAPELDPDTEKALAALLDFDRWEIREEFYALLLVNFPDKIASSQILQRIERQLAERIIDGSQPGTQSYEWLYFFLPLLTRLGLLEGATECVVVSPSGRLHHRDRPTADSTDCGKTVTGKWLLQFARGADIHPRYRYGHEICNGCLTTYTSAYGNAYGNAYSKDSSIARELYAADYEAAVAAVTSTIRQLVTTKSAARLRTFAPLTADLIVKISGCFTKTVAWQARNHAFELFADGLQEKAESLLEHWAVRGERSAHRAFARSLAERFCSLQRSYAIAMLFAEVEPDLTPFAVQAYGSLADVPLPEPNVIAAALAASERAERSVENELLPMLLSTVWAEKMTSLIREAHHESGKNFPRMLLLAYRQLPGRKPKHHQGTHTIDQQGFVKALRSYMKEEKLSVEALAAEVNLDADEIEQVLQGEEPSLRAYFTLIAVCRYHAVRNRDALTFARELTKSEIEAPALV